MTATVKHPYPPENGLQFVLANIVTFCLSNKLTILLTVVASLGLALLVAVFTSPRYTSATLLTPSQLDFEISDTINVSKLAGLDLGLPENNLAIQAVAILNSRDFAVQFAKENDLLSGMFPDRWDNEKGDWLPYEPGLLDGIRSLIAAISDDQGSDAFQSDTLAPTEWRIHNDFSDLIAVKTDRRTGLVTISFEWDNPVKASNLVSKLTRKINQLMRARDIKQAEQKLSYLRRQLEEEELQEVRQMIFRQIERELKKKTIAEVLEDYVFVVLDPPIPSERRTAPKRFQIVLFGLFGGLLLGMLIAFVRSSFRLRKALVSHADGTPDVPVSDT